MRSKGTYAPAGKRLIQRDLEQHLPPMGYCTACGKRFFNQPPDGPPLTYCGCLGSGVGLREAPRRFCPGCGNRKRCRCKKQQHRPRRGGAAESGK
jgi:hypothetical protein